MTYEFNLIFALWALAGLVVGLLLGRLTWGRAARRHKLAAESVSNAATAAAARTQADQAQRELAASQAAMRPLADEVDRLKRELAKAKRPVVEPLPAIAPMLPMEQMGSGGGTAVGGTGPIVVAAPDIRQLKGVGDKFAAALAAIGLTSVDQLARLNAGDAADADGRLGVFNGRIAKDQLVDQATLLDEGRTTEYEARFGKLGGPVLI